jgi:hypothetical protein
MWQRDSQDTELREQLDSLVVKKSGLTGQSTLAVRHGFGVKPDLMTLGREEQSGITARAVVVVLAGRFFSLRMRQER